MATKEQVASDQSRFDAINHALISGHTSKLRANAGDLMRTLKSCIFEDNLT